MSTETKIDNDDSSVVELSFENSILHFCNTYPTHTQNMLQKTGHFLEYDLLADARRFLRPDDVVIDVGAHVGNHTIFFSAICHCFVIAFEPDQNNYEMLKRNIFLNNLEKRVELWQAALSSQSGLGQVVDGPTATASTRRLSLTSDGSVSVVRLDDVALEKRVHLLKIDVEGHELQVLLGAAKLIERYRPRIYVECLDEDGFSAVSEYLKQFTYRANACFGDSPTFVFSPDAREEFVVSSDREFGLAAIHQRNVRTRRIADLTERLAGAKEAQRREVERAKEAAAAQRREAKRAAQAETVQRREAKRAAQAETAQKREAKRAARAEATQKREAERAARAEERAAKAKARAAKAEAALEKIVKGRTYRIGRFVTRPARKLYKLWASVYGRTGWKNKGGETGSD